MLAPQSFKIGYDEKTQATCALVAAVQAAGITSMPDFRQQYSWCIENWPVRCPACGRKGQSPAAVIVYLNDHHRWSREAIADWVEALEVKRGVQESELQNTEAVYASNAVIKKLRFAINVLAWIAGCAAAILPYPGFIPFFVISCLSVAILFLIDSKCRFLRRNGAPPTRANPEADGAARLENLHPVCVPLAMR
jgi:hypothetical protein